MGAQGRRAAHYRDPVRSTAVVVAFVAGLSLICLALLIRPPWGEMPLALPLGVRLYRKQGPTHLEPAAAMGGEVAAWFPERRFRVVADGASSALAQAGLPRTVLVSRIRRSAELYEPVVAPRLSGRRGRPRKRGQRLPSPCQMAQQTGLPWRRGQLEARGHRIERLGPGGVLVVHLWGDAGPAGDRPRPLWPQRR